MWEKPKEEILHDLGFSKMQTNRLETLADNPNFVEYFKTEARENGEFPTRARILKLVVNNKQSGFNSSSNLWHFLSFMFNFWKYLTLFHSDYQIIKYLHECFSWDLSRFESFFYVYYSIGTNNWAWFFSHEVQKFRGNKSIKNNNKKWKEEN